ncbi:HK97 gp10 family phage protein [Desulfosporosinus sp.]|uniref:HK97 gp10 family phage protein n=1 Tax=Desulfosporosinus sp. TaxID=157907 RepID=UPI0025BA8375|nr:HK97 gp10 family phage protein [Desulfosporosinus sp.]MBC2722339.1 HK97 gp10 family phage protein [Desulfosporosinus sp.]MBC2728627.1 HK97 gp10 family phage protein [Desulfosporosinus sp.]
MAYIRIDQLANEIANSIREYTEDVTVSIEREVGTTADNVLAETERLAPKRKGKYAASFVKTDKSLPGNRRYVIWNKKFYRLVHLLEFGHAKRGGGRVQAYPHLGPAHDKYAPRMVRNIERIIRNGG